MAKKEKETTETTMFDTMPGADKPDSEVNDQLDMNFGMGEEDAGEQTESVDEPVAEATEEIEATEEVEETEEEPQAEVEEEVSEETQEETVAETEETPPVEEPVVEEAVSEPEPPKDKPMVPKSRLDEVLSKQKALQKQLDDMKKAQEPAVDAPEAYDFDAKELEYQNLVLDGESKKAVALRQEMRQAEKTQIEYEMNQKMEQTVHQSHQANALQSAASELEASFPVFDQNSADYNAEYTQEVIEHRDAFMVQGFDAVDALSKAAKFVIKSYDLETPTPLESNQPTLSGNAAPKAPVDEVAKKRAEVGKKIKAAQAQPPELPGESSASRGEKAIDVTTMTEEEFNALPEKTLARLRGDIF